MHKNYNFQTKNFRIEEFLINGVMPSLEIQEKIYFNFMRPLQVFRERVHKPIIISKKSCYRSAEYEKMMLRGYVSKHQFKGMGACDVVCNLVDLELMFDMCLFPRLIHYPHKGFVHVDYTYNMHYDCALYRMAADEKTMEIIKYKSKVLQ